MNAACQPHIRPRSLLGLIAAELWGRVWGLEFRGEGFFRRGGTKAGGFRV